LARVSKPAGVWGRVCWGKGKGCNIYTLDKPLPLPGVKGIYKIKKCEYMYLKNTFFGFFLWIFPSKILFVDLYKL
jgi:hypothetical protein